MFDINCVPSLLQKLEEPEKHFPLEICSELESVLGCLKRDGQLKGTDFFDTSTHRISAKTFFLFYRPDFDKKTVLIAGLRAKTAGVLKEQFSVKDDWNDDDVIEAESIPQYDKPQKIVQALSLIYQDITNSYELGYQLGHKAKKKKDVSRHGQYAKHTLEQLSLIAVQKNCRPHQIILTDKGKLIAEASDQGLKFRLLVEAMLAYPPVWRVITAVTEREGVLGDSCVLNDILVKEIVYPMRS